MAVKADVKSVLCFTDILFSAFLTLDQVHWILGLAGDAGP